MSDEPVSGGEEILEARRYTTEEATALLHELAGARALAEWIQDRGDIIRMRGGERFVSGRDILGPADELVERFAQSRFKERGQEVKQES
jgi:hypothetical protein